MNVRALWKKTKIIRPFYWWCYKQKLPSWIRKKHRSHRRDRLLFETLPEAYRRHRSEPADKSKIIFCVARSKKDVLPASMVLLERELREHYDFNIHIHYLHNTTADYKQYVKEARAFVEDMATAAYVFTDEANEVVSCVDKRPETYVANVWHACGAFKKFGMSTAEKVFGNDRNTLERHPNYANLNLVSVSSPEVRWAYVEAMNLKKTPEIVKATGISRTDVFFDEAYRRSSAERVYQAFPAARGKKIILYAPTFRGHVKTAAAPDRLDFQKFYNALNKEYVLIVKHHPFVRELPPIPEDLKNTFAFDASGKLDINDLLCVSDICISDYSSVIFEYSLFVRPMVFFAYDLDEYDDWRGFYYPYRDMTPGPVLKTNEEITDYIQHLEERFDRQQVKNFRDKFMSACDGRATQRILDEVFSRPVLDSHRKGKP